MTSVGLASNVKVLSSVLGKLLKEECQESINILSSSDRVADGTAAVRVAHIDGLVEEDHRGIAVPRVRVMHNLECRVDGCRAELHEETSQRGATRTTIEPQHHRIGLGIVAGLEEP